MNTWDTVIALIDIELNVFFTKAAIKPSLSESVFMEMIFELRAISLKQTYHQHHVLLPTLSSSDTQCRESVSTTII